MITIAVDAMGGDHAPRPRWRAVCWLPRIRRAHSACRPTPGRFARSWPSFDKPDLPIEIVPASEVITMEDHPAQAFRRKKDSSVHVAARLVQEGKADGFVSAGNTGAVMTTAKFIPGHAGIRGSRGTGRSVSRMPRAVFPSCWMSAPTWIPSPSISCNLGDGRDLLPRDLWQPQAPRRLAFRRRRRNQGQRTDARGLRRVSRHCPCISWATSKAAICSPARWT